MPRDGLEEESSSGSGSLRESRTQAMKPNQGMKEKLEANVQVVNPRKSSSLLPSVTSSATFVGINQVLAMLAVIETTQNPDANESSEDQELHRACMRGLKQDLQRS
jgi:hypothetical protein